MKKLIVMLLLVVGITAFAQEKEMRRNNGDKFASLTPEQKVEYQVKKMSNDLSLNDKQVKEVEALVTKEIEKRENKKSENKAFRAQKRKKMEQDGVAKSQEMKKILNPEQFAEWEKINAERKEKVKEKMDKKRGGQPQNEIPDEK